MSNLDLVAPAVAIVALFGVIGLIVQSIRQGRAIRQIEDRLREGGAAAAEVSLDRIRQLQTRAELSSGTRRGTGPAVTIVALLGVAVLVGGAWFWFTGRDDGGGGPTEASAQESPANGQTADDGSGNGDTPPADGDNGEGSTDADPTLTDGVPEEAPPLLDKSQVRVAIFNASGVAGAAGEKTRGLVEQEGYSIGEIANSPDGRTDLATSIVQYPDGNEDVALNVAEDLGIAAGPFDGLTQDQIGLADVVVIVGLDLANRP